MAATELDLVLVWLAQYSELAVQALLGDRDYLELVKEAEKQSEITDAAVNKLAEAVKDAVVPKRRLFRRSSPAELEHPPSAM